MDKEIHMSYALMSLLLMLCPLSYLITGQTIDTLPPVSTTEAIPVVTNYLEENFGYGMDITWTPTEEDILAMEEGVSTFLIQSENPMFGYSQTPAWERLNEYVRQYYGLTIEGENVIHAEFYCDALDRWQEEPIIVMDGGDCFFRFDYNPVTDTFFNLSVNGMA
jgi:hypothetical protein